MSPAVWRHERKRTRSSAVAGGETPQCSELEPREGAVPLTIAVIMDQR
ncbi:MAG TPA: hypothetical protein PKD12_11545 [Nitrospira sp.]|nr:hypothetical protein [Nitrospira sp.]HMS84276.1 hypothetical protein [Nitrospira sp.]